VNSGGWLYGGGFSGVLWWLKAVGSN